MGLAFGWNAYLHGITVDWQLAKQSTAFVYLGADKTFQQGQQDALHAGLLVGGYWSLESSLAPAEQVDLFLSRLGEVKRSHLPPAVWVYREEQLLAAKTFVEVLEAKTKRRTLIGGTPASLRRAGLIFGRTNPLWISHKPLFGGPSLPTGWDRFAVWQTEPSGQVKGVRGAVGLNGADGSFISRGKEKLAVGLGALALVGAAVYYYSKEVEGT